MSRTPPMPSASRVSSWIATSIGLGLVLALTLSTSAAGVKQQRFPSPEAAVTALVEAVKTGDKSAMLAVLGPNARRLVSSGDEVADRTSRERFVRSYEEAHRLVRAGDAQVTLLVGTSDWPSPVPLVQDGAGWRFDTARGKEEILNRRIGRNELSAMQVCLAYVDAQRDYARLDALADSLTRFAPSEICELARSQDVVVRALANEALALFPTSVLVSLLSDPVDSEIGRDALRRQAVEYGSEEARQIVSALDQVDLDSET